MTLFYVCTNCKRLFEDPSLKGSRASVRSPMYHFYDRPGSRTVTWVWVVREGDELVQAPSIGAERQKRRGQTGRGSRKGTGRERVRSAARSAREKWEALLGVAAVLAL
jgi:hypothetical protein